VPKVVPLMHYLLSPQASTTERDAAPLYLGLSWSRDLDLDPSSPRSAPPPWQLSLVQPGLAVWCMWVQHGGISAEHLVSLVLLQCASLAILSLGNAIACVPPFCLPSSFLEAFSHVRSCDVLPHAYVCFTQRTRVTSQPQTHIMLCHKYNQFGFTDSSH
jgi:hypothetical protein